MAGLVSRPSAGPNDSPRARAWTIRRPASIAAASGCVSLHEKMSASRSAVAVCFDRAGDGLDAPVGDAVGDVSIDGDSAKAAAAVRVMWPSRIVCEEAFELDDVRAGRQRLGFVVERRVS